MSPRKTVEIVSQVPEKPRVAKNMFFAACLIALCGFALPILQGCTTTSPGTEVATPPAPRDDADYAPILKKWTKSVSVVDKFQKKVDVNAVLFTEEFRKAYAARWARLHGEAPERFPAELGSGQIGLLVSLFSPEAPYEDLANSALWNLQLRFGPSMLSPVSVKPLGEKSILESYFPFISTWSGEYLVVFDMEEGDGPSPGFVLPERVDFSMRSAIASILFTWP